MILEDHPHPKSTVHRLAPAADVPHTDLPFRVCFTREIQLPQTLNRSMP